MTKGTAVVSVSEYLQTSGDNIKDVFGQIWIAAAAIFVATCYLSGSSYLRIFARYWGLSANPAEFTFQEIISIGFQVTFVPFWIAFTILVCASTGCAVWREWRKAAGKRSSPRASFVFRLSTMWIGVMLPTLILAGNIRAKTAYDLIERDIAGKCRNCWNYRVGTEIVKGTPLFEDNANLYLATTGKVVVIKRAEIREISKANASKPTNLYTPFLSS